MRGLLLTLFAMAFLIGCGTDEAVVLPQPTTTRTPDRHPSIEALPTTYSFTPTIIRATRTSAIAPQSTAATATRVTARSSECAISLLIIAWLDFDANGRWDNSELPLEGVMVRALYYGHALPPHTTGPDGAATIILSMISCPVKELRVTAKAPVGYRLTTPATIDGTSPPLRFGFVPAP